MNRILVALAVFAVASLRAETLISTQTGFGGISSFNDNVGYSFLVGTSPLRVDQLGVFDAYGNGLFEKNRITIYENSGAIVTSVDIPRSTLATLSGEYRWVNAPAGIILQKNTAYVISAYPVHEYGIEFGYTLEDRMGGTITTTADVTLTAYLRSGYNSGYVFPNQNLSGSGIIGPNMSYTLVPEPSSLSLLLAGGAVLMAGRRRK